MPLDLEYINELSLKEIAGTITAEERVVLEQGITEDINARRFYEHLHQGLRQLPGNAVTPSAPITPLVPAARKKFPKLAAAALLLLIAGAGTFALLNRPGKPAQLAVNKLNAGQVQLSFASGTHMQLGNQQGRLKVNNVSLSITGGTIQLHTTDTTHPETVTLRVPNGRDYKVELQDGSIIWLNAASAVSFRVPFHAGKRSVYIEGEAYLKIAPNAGQPFIVQLPHSQVQVLGTEFNVNSYDSRHDAIALLSGSVRVKSGADSLVLRPGSQATGNGRNKILVNKFDAMELLAWRDGLQLLDNADIAEIQASIVRNFALQVKITGEADKFQSFTGTVERKKPVSVFLEKLKEAEIINGYNFSADSVIYLK
ncbi:FecR family protein [uncultured Chitinophaga sp.]|uniref:FecR family protein n=1 Tax=uncultured Chitinophaga sp. TaxID=339340 RepID=UPI0025DA485D|nr:FecR domain-containing protein [uncultured Chitinophaga sp.]